MFLLSPRHEQGLSAALLECALHAAAKDGILSRACRQQAAALKISLAQNELQLHRGLKAHKADVGHGRKAARSVMH
ncbi:hypothetical protein GPECTOR_6g486 [Gonium pectorale]|uniref:Uncharacterized protein n=1 Tax=Gonium pectorale TaxID=33097 RepID=A0A150GUP9_GONPE|nr:hypothetical protein GPECTOR_6g486 [Gonium pectorale]|eukprot:KXZ53569.1 hypothetical protein GPECTOR_6g486 [Gonium pectorale]